MIEWVSTKWNKNYEIVTGFQHLEHTGTQNQVSHLKIVSKPPKLSICNNQNIWHVKENERRLKYTGIIST